MKKGTEIIIVNAYEGATYQNGDKGFYTGEDNLFIINKEEYRLYAYEYEEIREPHIFDQIIEEMRRHEKWNLHLDIMDDFSGYFTIKGEECKQFNNLESALSWLKEQNKPKEKTIRIEGRDFTIDELKKMIEGKDEI